MKKGDWMTEGIPVFLAVTTTVGFFSLLALLYFRPVDGASKDILQVLLGGVSVAWMTMVNYYFGSSKGSAKKTDIMADTATATADAMPVTTTTTTPETTITETKPKETL